MSPIEITVRGRHRRYAPPERATARLAIAVDGPQRQAVIDEVATLTRQVGDGIRSLHDPGAGPVTWWSAGQLRTWSQRPFHKDGKQRPPVHYARVELEAKFADFAVLGRWLTDVVAVDRVRLDRIDWDLTEAHRRELTAAVRTAAVTDARDKAQAYADALGLGPVRPSALADAGMLGDGRHPESPQTGVGFARAMAAPAGGGSAEVELSPNDIEVAAEIDARFVTD